MLSQWTRKRDNSWGKNDISKSTDITCLNLPLTTWSSTCHLAGEDLSFRKQPHSRTRPSLLRAWQNENRQMKQTHRREGKETLQIVDNYQCLKGEFHSTDQGLLISVIYIYIRYFPMEDYKGRSRRSGQRENSCSLPQCVGNIPCLLRSSSLQGYQSIWTLLCVSLLLTTGVESISKWLSWPFQWVCEYAQRAIRGSICIHISLVVWFQRLQKDTPNQRKLKDWNWQTIEKI